VYGYRNWTWVILKAHTGNYGPKAGTVKPRSNNPRDTPIINFNFFDAGRTEDGADVRDLRAMAEGVELARNITESAIVPSLIPGKSFTEKMPGPQRSTMTKVMNHIRNEAWSHHASCTCKIGLDNDPTAVLDSKLRVRGVEGLRVADASVFPRIPGFFVAVPTYMIGEQAAEMILGKQT
jgi:choline dehydrogenase